MIFATSIGTDGHGDERYIVYVPFTLAPGRKLDKINEPVQFQFGEHSAKLEKLHHLYAITVGTFINKEEAFDFIPYVTSSLLWLSLAYKVGVSYPKELSSPRMYEHPIAIAKKSNIKGIAEAVGWDQVDGDYDADKTTVLPDHRKLTRWEMGQVSVTQGLGISNFIEKVTEAIGFPHLDNINSEPRLKLAIELYSAFSYEASKNAQFVSLITCLESLTPSSSIPAFAKEHLNAAKEVIKERRNKCDNNLLEWEELNHLLSRLGGLGKNAIGKSMRSYLSSIVQRHPSLGDPDDIEDKIKKSYDLRSKLLHDGKPGALNVDEYLGFLREFVPLLLTALFVEQASNMPAE